MRTRQPFAPFRGTALAILSLSCFAGSPSRAQTLTPVTSEIREGDRDPAEAVFAYQTPAGGAGSYELAVIPRNLVPGRDFTPFRSTFAPGANGSVNVPVLPDLREEENGGLNLVLRGPESADWAAAMSAPQTVAGFPSPQNGGDIVYWRADLVVAARHSASGEETFADTYERAPNGQLTLRSTLSGAAGTFTANGLRVSRGAIVANEAGTLRTWLRRSDRKYEWTAMADLPVPVKSADLQGDRLIAGWEGQNAVYRLDPSHPTGWRLTGTVGNDPVIAVGGDFVLTSLADKREVWQRTKGEEDIWEPAGQVMPGPDNEGFSVAVGDGVFAIPGADGLEIHERSPAGVWGKAATLPVSPPAAGRRMSVAFAGDWIAVGEGSLTKSAPPGTVRLFLRSVTDRSVWDAAGAVSGPGGGYGSHLLWDGRELISLTASGPDGHAVVVRGLPGAEMTVLDDDREKLNATTFTLREPLGATASEICFAELPLPAAHPVIVDYELLSGTAAAGTDFVQSTGQVTIPAGSARVAIPLTLLGDSEVEFTESFTVRLTTPGQPPVSGEITLRDSDPAPVITAYATRLIEGFGESTVTVNQTPVTGTSLPATPVKITAVTGGFVSPGRETPFATENADLPTRHIDLNLSAEKPTASWSFAANQDAEKETGEDEDIRAFWKNLDHPREYGTLGIAYRGTLPLLPADVVHPTGTADPISSAGEWLFATHWRAHLPNTSSTGLVGCYRRLADRSGFELMQLIPLDSDSGSAKHATDGRILMVCLRRTDGGSPREILRLYEPRSGGEGEPWIKTAEWMIPSPATSGYVPRVITGDRIEWEGWRMERCGGPWTWRMTNTAESHEGRGILGPTGTTVDADGEWLLTTKLQEITAHKRERQGPVPWKMVTTFTGAKGTAARNSAFGGYLRGSTLVVLTAPAASNDRFEIYQETSEDAWRFEQSFPDPSHTGLWSQVSTSGFHALFGQSTLLHGDRIFSRTGPGSSPWVQTAWFDTNWYYYPQLRSVSDDGIFAHSFVRSDGFTVLLRGGFAAPIYDDDTFSFFIGRFPSSGGLVFPENAHAESVGLAKVFTSKSPPFPQTVRLRSRDTGSAVAGVDYVPFDVNVTADWSSYTLPISIPIRILPDRIYEKSEAFGIYMDPPLFGATASTTASITDKVPTPVVPAKETVTLFEPPVGTQIQTVEFLFEHAFEQDIAFRASLQSGGQTGAVDARAPSANVVLRAGENRLRVPIEVLADQLEEDPETFIVRVNFSPASDEFSVSSRVTILDSASAGLKADGGYSVPQNTELQADGLEGRPSGVAANDPAAPPGSGYAVRHAPDWGELAMSADGSFRLRPHVNVVGPAFFFHEVAASPPHTYLDSTAVWRYLHPGSSNSTFRTTWSQPAFNDNAWATGLGTLDYGGIENVTTLGGVTLITPPEGSRYTSYFRTTFHSDTAHTVQLRLRLYCDDGAIIYINGVERGRAEITDSPTFKSAPDTYFLVTRDSIAFSFPEDQPLIANLGSVDLNQGINHLAISLHNMVSSSSDLGLRLIALETTPETDAVSVRVDVTDGHLPPEGTADSYECPQNAQFLSSDGFGASVLDNDGLHSITGAPYDPVLEVTASPVSTGALSLVGKTGHFRYTPPADFVGTAKFTYQIRDKDGLSAPIPVILTVVPSLPYDIWRRDQLGSSTFPNSDPDGDGLSNFLEYTLRSSPTEGNLQAGSGFYPSEPENGLTFILPRVKDVAWQLESADSPDAEEWKVVAEGRGSNYVSRPTSEEVKSGSTSLRILPLPQSAPRRFYRLRSFSIPPQ